MTEQPPREPTPESLKIEVEHLLKRLYEYDIDSLEEADKKTWYEFEMAAKCGKDKDLKTAKENLQAFVEYLDDEFKLKAPH